MRILGIISASILKGFVVFSDNFNRSTTGSLGTSSSGGLWNAVRGVWSANGTQATSSGAASDYPLATVPMLSPNNVLKVATSNGVGLAFWVSGAGDWWAAVPVSTSASENFSTCTFNSCCSTTAKSCCYAFGVNTSPSVCNSFVDLDYGPIYLDSGSQCVSSNCCTGSPTNTRTRFYWALRVIKAIGGVFTTESEVAIANSLTNSNLINSISAVTAGDSLVATAFSDTNSLTQTGTPITIPLTNSVKANGVGIIKTPSTNNQGSTADNFTVN
jgi:hypothetical protein